MKLISWFISNRHVATVLAVTAMTVLILVCLDINIDVNISHVRREKKQILSLAVPFNDLLVICWWVLIAVDVLNSQQAPEVNFKVWK